MKINYLYFLIFPSMCIFFIACNSDKNKNKLGDEDWEQFGKDSSYRFTLRATGDTARYSQQSAFKAEAQKPKAEAENNTRISISFPRIDSFKNTAVKDSINNFIKDFLLADEAGDIAYESVQERLDEFIKEYGLAEKEMKKELVFSSKWRYDIQIQVVLNTHKILALRFYEFNYTGGAHPNEYTLYINFDMKTGKVIELEDFLTVGYRNLLLAAAEKRFRKALHIDPTTPIVETQFEFPDGRFVLPRNFAITRSGLRFCYNPYDIGPYSLGSIEFDLPFDDIIGIVKTEALGS